MPRKRLFFSLGGGGGGGSRKGGTGFSVSNYDGLNDTPNTKTGQAGKIIQVNVGETAHEYIPGRGQVNGVASLDASGLIPTAQLPPLAITDFLGVVANQAAMLALSGQRGDWCIRSDLSTVWILTADDPSILANWQEVAYPVDPSKVLIDATDDTPDYMGNKLYSFLGTHSGISIGKLGVNPNQKIELQVSIDDSTINFDGSENIRVKPLGITDAQVAVANKDGAAATPSMRTLGTGALQACAGNDSRLGTKFLYQGIHIPAEQFFQRVGYANTYGTVTLTDLIYPCWTFANAGFPTFLIRFPVLSRYWTQLYINLVRIYAFGVIAPAGGNDQIHLYHKFWYVPSGQTLNFDAGGSDNDYSLALTTNNYLYYGEQTNCTINVPAGAIGSTGMIYGKIVRDAANVGDTYPNDAYIPEVFIELALGY